MNQKELTAAIATAANLSIAAVESVLKAQAEVVKKTLANGDDITLHHQLGKLKLSHSNARPGRNPATGEAIEIPAKTRVVFKPAAGLKESLN